MVDSFSSDRWGNGLGTQAARINQLLSTPEFRTIDEIYEILVREFPTTTRSRVSSHIKWLRDNYGSYLRSNRMVAGNCSG
jgi:hypothetical protein